jgi:hypothetical protein
MPVSRRKVLLKCERLQNPVKSAIRSTGKFVSVGNCLAAPIRTRWISERIDRFTTDWKRTSSTGHEPVRKK